MTPTEFGRWLRDEEARTRSLAIRLGEGGNQLAKSVALRRASVYQKVREQWAEVEA